MIYNIKGDEIEDFCNSNKMFAKVIDHDHDISKYLSIIEEFPYQPISKDSNPYYESIGLQYSNPDSPYYDSVETVWYMDDRHTEIKNTESVLNWKSWNDLGLKLQLNNYDLYRTRVLKAKPGCNSVWHIDYDWRYHIPLVTNKDCIIRYRDTEIHMPATGHAYINNAGFMHKFENKGNADRYHICGILNYNCKGDGICKRCL